MKQHHLTIAALLALSIAAHAQNPVKTVTQVTQAEEITEAIDFTIQGTDPFASLATIDIQNPDAAVVFADIRPSDVIGKYLNKITVNGIKLENNVNCRVSIYRHGSIVMPHSDTSNADGSSFYPVTFFSDDNCTEEIGSYNGDARRTTGPWVDNARSFTLKRGYMCTVANDAAGTGYSHCYIANTKDLKITLRKQLAGKLGFFRIFRWQWPAKKGTCDVGPEEFNATWHYNWGAGTSSGTNYEYVPQRHHESGESNGQGWKGAWPSWNEINASNGTCTHVLGQNEPDNTSGSGEVYTYVTSVPENHREKCSSYPLIDVAKDFLYSGKRIGTFACCNPSTGWVSDYVNWCRQNNIRIDFVATHYYIGGQSPQGCIDRLWSLYNATGLPVWATEWNNGANWTTEGGFSTDAGWYSWGSGNDSKKNGEWLTDVLKRADRPENHWLERLACYNAVEAKREIKTNGQISEGGKLYRDYNSTFAYDDANEYFMPWTYKAPHDLEIDINKTSKRVTLKWQHDNSKQSDSIFIQRKVAEGSNAWETVHSLGMLANGTHTATYQDTEALLLSDMSGVVSYRIADYDSDGKIRYSNDVSVTLGSAQGNETIQYGKLTITNLNPVNVDFANAFEDIPSVFMGPVSNANTDLYPGNLLTSIAKAKFSYQILPWQTSKSTTFAKNEETSFMSMLPGNYKFGGLDCEVGVVKANMVDTIEVAFQQAFPEGITPVVLTELRNPSLKASPIIIKLKDITNTGFKCILMYEDKVGQKSRVNQNVSYLAVTPGFDYISPEEGIAIGAGRVNQQIYGTTNRTVYFTINSDGETADTLKLANPKIFTNLQTNNYDAAAIVRKQGDVTIKDANGTTLTYGIRLKRITDSSRTTTPDGTKLNTTNMKDDIGWVVIANVTPVLAPVTIDDITSLIDKYLNQTEDSTEPVTIDDITALIDRYLAQ